MKKKLQIKALNRQLDLAIESNKKKSELLMAQTSSNHIAD